uniref:Opa interacting protein 5 n=1 Tax=Anser brachyrhynchus TaxID=132585 RepID=A0A8B9CG33_9AVES
MAVRRQLWRLFQEPHISGVITVEQPPPAPPTPPPPPAPPTPPPPPPDPSPAEAPLRRRGLRPEDCAVFQCHGCRAVLADSLHLCAQEERRLGLLVCLRVTGDVAWEDALLVGLEGALLGCAYNALYCRSCGSMVGFILYSAFSNLAHLRGLFCFFKESILCYLLKNKITIEASKVNFPALTLKEQLGKVRFLHDFVWKIARNTNIF